MGNLSRPPAVILVTGAAGRLGSQVVRILAAKGLQVRAADVRKRMGPSEAVDWRIADLTDAGACAELLKDLTHVAHLATAPHGNLPAGHAANMAMHQNILAGAAEAGVRRIVFASSIQAVVGEDQDGNVPGKSPRQVPCLPADGNAPASPGNPYGVSKEFGENVLFRLCRERHITGVNLRFPMLFEDVTSVRQGAFQIHPSHIAHVFAWLSLADAAGLVATALMAETPGCRTYLPAAPSPNCGLPVKTLIRRFYSGVPWRVGATRESLVDISALRRDFNWAPRDLAVPRIQPWRWWHRLPFLGR